MLLNLWGSEMLKRQVAGVLILVALQAAAEDWTASIKTVHEGLVFGAPPIPGQFSYEVGGFYEVLSVPGNPAFRKIGYGPTGREYETFAYLTNGYLTVDLAGSSDIIAWVVPHSGPPDGGAYPARLYVEKQGEDQFFTEAGSLADYALTKAYIGRVSLSVDGSVVSLPTTVCGNDCFGQVEAWKLNEAGQYQKVVSHRSSDGPSRMGLAASSSANRVVTIGASRTVLNEAGEEIIQTTVLIYNIVIDNILTDASEEITLSVAQFGTPRPSIDINQDGSKIALVMEPSDDYPSAPASEGGVVVFSKAEPCVLQCGWTQKGQIIDPAPSLTDFAYRYQTWQTLLSQDGDTVAVLTMTDCFSEDEGAPEGVIQPCHSGLITVWDFNNAINRWEERQGEGFPIAVPAPDPSQEHRARLSGFDANRGVLGVSVEDNREEDFYLMKVTMEKSTNTGLPIWLLYEASQ